MSTMSPLASTTTACTYAEAQTPVLLQTARAQMCATSHVVEARAILDCGSQGAYITKQVQRTLSLKLLHTEIMVIKTFGANKKTCYVELGVIAKNGEMLTLTTLVVPAIYSPICCQPISLVQNSYKHLSSIKLADSADSGENLEINILIGAGHYWSLVTGRVLKGKTGPTAIQVRLGQVLSGPIETIDQGDSVVNLVVTHSLLQDTSEPKYLDDDLQHFWNLESLGILQDEQSIYDTFTQQITIQDKQYVVNLPSHPALPSNYELCQQ